jgi:hypothetical protein
MVLTGACNRRPIVLDVDLALGMRETKEAAWYDRNGVIIAVDAGEVVNLSSPMLQQT